jgi:hypothetical protein
MAQVTLRFTLAPVGGVLVNLGRMGLKPSFFELLWRWLKPTLMLRMDLLRKSMHRPLCRGDSKFFELGNFFIEKLPKNSNKS